MNLLVFSLLLFTSLEWKEIKAPSQSSYRSIAVGEQGFVCVTGTRLPSEPNGTGKGSEFCTRDGGDTWEDCTPTHVTVSDYRCSVLVDSNTLVIASAGSPAVILRSEDLGKSWETTYQNSDPAAFIDSVCFWDEKRGIAFGDPLNGRFLLLTTEDGGRSWQTLDCKVLPRPGEAGFAASNGLICFPDSRTVVIGLGGGVEDQDSSGQSSVRLESRVLRSDDAGSTWNIHTIPCIPAGPSSGVFAVQVRENGIGVAVGGDYKVADAKVGNVAITSDGGLNWRRPTGKPPSGFRSAIVYVEPTSNGDSSGYWLTVGPNGTDVSVDGEDWRTVSKVGFHAVAQLPALQETLQESVATVGVTHLIERMPIAVGSEGRVGVLRAMATDSP